MPKINEFHCLWSTIHSIGMVAVVEERPSITVPTHIQASSGDPMASTNSQSHHRWRASGDKSNGSKNGSNHLTSIKQGKPLIDVAEIVRDSPKPMSDLRYIEYNKYRNISCSCLCTLAMNECINHYVTHVSEKPFT